MVGERRVGVHRREVRLLGIVLVVEDGALGVLVGEVGLVAVPVLTLGVVDDVGRVVGDDVEEDLHALGVRLADEGLEVGIRPEVWVDLGEVGDPVAVVAGTHVVAGALDGAVLERRGEPDGGRPEALDVVEMVRQALEVPAVVEALVARVEAGDVPAAGQAAGVVARVAVGEPVGHDEVEPLPRQRGPQRVRRVCRVPRRRAVRDVGRGDADPVARVVVGDGELGRPGDDERDVRPVLHAVGAVVLVPAVVDRDLQLVAARRDVEHRGIHRRRADLGEVGRGAGLVPVPGTADLGLQRPDEGHRAVRGERGRGGRQTRGERNRGRGEDGKQTARRSHRWLPHRSAERELLRDGT